jgi:hypothetical protein
MVTKILSSLAPKNIQKVAMTCATWISEARQKLCKNKEKCIPRVNPHCHIV